LRPPRLILPVLAAACLLGSTLATASQVSDSDITAENARFIALGVTLPKGGVILKQPYALPYQNRSFIVPLTWLDNDPKFIRADAMRQDLPILRLLMQKTYPGWNMAASRGWDWNAWFADWDLQLALDGKKELTATQAVAPWITFRKFLLDNHSHPMVLGIEGQTLSAKLEQRPNGSCDLLHADSGKDVRLNSTDRGQQPHVVSSWSGSSFHEQAYIAYPDDVGPVESIRCNGRPVNLTMTEQPLLQPGPAYYKDLGEGIGYIRASGIFSYASNERIRMALSANEQVDKQKAIILDVRMNGGGAAPLDILSHWFSREALAGITRPGTYLSLHSCYAIGLQFNLGQEFLMRGLKAPLPTETKSLVQNIMNAIGDDSPNACDVKEVRRHSAWTLLDHHFEIENSGKARTRIVVVVDNECGSDCEGLVTDLAQLPGTVIAGTSTAGTIGFLQPGMFVLPHSRLPFMLAQAYADLYGDGRSQAGYGLSVDVLLATKQSQELGSLKALALALTTN
jgi:hypothetical protein